MTESGESCTLPVIVTRLHVEDLDDLMPIEQASFSLPWPRSVYRHELTRNPRGYYLAIRPAPRFQKPLALQERPLPPLLAYGGFWKLYEEAHICTIASHPHYRGRGLGEWMLLHLLDLARSIGAEVATLEVREHNRVAQRLYERLGFQSVGRRPRYYSDTGEDALIMTLSALNSPEVQARLAQRRAIVKDKLCAWARELSGATQ